MPPRAKARASFVRPGLQKLSPGTNSIHLGGQMEVRRAFCPGFKGLRVEVSFGVHVGTTHGGKNRRDQRL